jgi:hypothetical protein
MLTTVLKGRGLRERLLRGIGSGDLYDRLIALETERNEFQRLLAAKAETPPSSDPIRARWGFIHIPKTGGMSVAETLQRVGLSTVGKALPYELANFPEVFEDTPILTGHIPYFVFRWEKHPRTLATVLRDPVERVVSFYRYVLATPGHYAHAFFQRFRPTLADCYDHPVLRTEISDFQTKMLGWSARSDIVFPAHGRAKYAIFWSEHVDFYYCPADAGTLATAQRRLLTDIQFACLARPASVLALCSRMTGHSVSALGTENRTPPVPWVPTEYDLEVAAVHNTHDIALYDFAVDLIDKADSCAG